MTSLLRHTRSLLVATIALAVLASCSAATPPTSPTDSAASAPPSPVAPSTDPSSPGTDPTGEPGAGGAPTAGPRIGPEGGCDPTQLEVLISRPASGSDGAGIRTAVLEWVNRADRPCNLEGNPAIVELAAGSRKPVGASASPSYEEGGGAVRLAPGRSAWSAVRIASGGAVDCARVPVDAIRVTAPHREVSTSIVLPLPDPVVGCRDGDTVLVMSGSITSERLGR